MVPPSGIFCNLNIVPLDRDNGTFNSSNTDVVEKVNFLVAASQHGRTSVAEGSPQHVDRNGFVLVTFHEGILWGHSSNAIFLEIGPQPTPS